MGANSGFEFAQQGQLPRWLRDPHGLAFEASFGRTKDDGVDLYKQATKAANAIRNYARAQKLDLRVSCPENKSCVYVFKSTLPPRTRKKKSESSALPPAVSDDAAPPVQS